MSRTEGAAHTLCEREAIAILEDSVQSFSMRGWRDGARIVAVRCELLAFHYYLVPRQLIYLEA